MGRLSANDMHSSEFPSAYQPMIGVHYLLSGILWYYSHEVYDAMICLEASFLS